MRILIRTPNWLGDGVMLSPIFEVLKKKYQDADFVFVGPRVVCDLYARDCRVKEIFIDTTKQSKNRFLATYYLAKQIGKCDIALTFANHFYSALLLFLTQSKVRIGYGSFLRYFLLNKIVKKTSLEHQVLSYAKLLEALQINFKPSNLKLICNPKEKDLKKSVGISTGAAFGASKIWYPEYFAQVIIYLLNNDYKVILFGSGVEADNNKKIIEEVKKEVSQNKLENLLDLSNKTSIQELVDWIGSLDLFLSNDSGPMHIATAIKIPLIALFGATHPTYCLPWQYDNKIIINKNLSCSPCQKKECPLGHHLCMKEIKPQEVIEAIKQLLGEKNAN